MYEGYIINDTNNLTVPYGGHLANNPIDVVQVDYSF